MADVITSRGDLAAALVPVPIAADAADNGPRANHSWAHLRALELRGSHGVAGGKCPDLFG